MEYRKTKSASKTILCKGPKLEDVVQKTLQTIASIVGGTLGPGGRQVLLERQEFDLPPLITKDGVTVCRSLGFTSPVQQCILESVRDASIATSNTAGDGTTTTCILAESTVRYTKEFCLKNPKVSPQKVVRTLQKCFKTEIEPLIKKLAVMADLSTPEGRQILKDVATVSANGDKELADAVMDCFDLVGDDGNVTLAELSGPSGYEVERVEGYPITTGYEDST